MNMHFPSYLEKLMNRVRNLHDVFREICVYKVIPSHLPNPKQRNMCPKFTQHATDSPSELILLMNQSHLKPTLCCLFFFALLHPLSFSVVVAFFVPLSLLAAHELEVVDLLELGDDELAPHVGDLHLQLVDLHVAQLHGVVDVVHLALGRHPPVVVCRTEDLLFNRACSFASTISQ